VSRHHILPPIVYTPEPRPKKVETRSTRRIQKKETSSLGASGDAEETDEASAFGATRRPAAQSSSNPFTPIEGAERRTQQASGKLSDDTLKTMLQVQETGSAQSTATLDAGAKR
jgi:hypothetical protein